MAEAVYETRLREYVKIVRDLPRHLVGPSWLGSLPSRTVEQWAQDVSAITLPETKRLLGAEEYPDAKTRLDLREISDELVPGVYTSCILTPDRPMETFSYVGSATGTKGLYGRTRQHLNQVYRDAEKQRRYSYHYQTVDKAGAGRTEHFRALAVASFGTGEPDDINRMRETCLVTEQLYMAWLQSFTQTTKRLHRWLEQLSPWKDGTLLGTNGSLPLAMSMIKADRKSGTTVEDQRELRNERFRAKYDDETVERREYRKNYRHEYRKNVEMPAKRMLESGASKEEVDAFRASFPKKSKRAGKPLEFETATERTPEMRAAEADGRTRPAKKKPRGNMASSADQTEAVFACAPEAGPGEIAQLPADVAASLATLVDRATANKTFALGAKAEVVALVEHPAREGAFIQCVRDMSEEYLGHCYDRPKRPEGLGTFPGIG